MKEWFVINDIYEFVEKARTIVYNKFGSWDIENPDELSIMLNDLSDSDIDELDKILSYNEALNIVKQSARKQTNKKNKKIRYIMNDKIFADIIHNLNSRMVSNILTGLVSKGLVESSFDSETNDFVFWIKEDKKETD